MRERTETTASSGTPVESPLGGMQGEYDDGVGPERRNRYQLGDILQCLLVGWGLFGHQALILIAVQQQMATRDLTVISRALTVAVAALAVGSLLLRPEHISRRLVIIPFLAFWAVYFLRLSIEILNQDGTLLDAEWLSLDYIGKMAAGACFIPALSILLNTCWNWHRGARRIVLGLAGLSSVMIVALYGTRLLRFEARMRSGEDVGDVVAIHPLALGYLGAAMLLFSFYLCCLLSGGATRRYLLAAATSALGVLLLVGSASRGPMVALSMAVFVLFCSMCRRKRIGRTLLVCVASGCLLASVLFIAQVTGSSLFDRLLSIEDDIVAQASSAARLDLYATAISAFLDSPLLGSSILLPRYDSYPHNLFIESLMATGLAGTIPFVMVVVMALLAAWRILIKRPDLGWIPLLFILYFTAGMFSWAIYTNVGFWIALAATLSCSEWIDRVESDHALDEETA